MKNIIFIYLISIILCQCSTSKNSLKEREDYPKADPEIFTDWSLYSKGLFFKSKKDYETAIRYFLDAACFKTALDRTYYQLALCNYYLLDYDSAIKYSKLSIKSNINFSKPYMLLHSIYLNLKDYNASADILESLIDVDPELIDIHFSLGILYYNKIKNYDKALVFFRNIIELENIIHVNDYYKEHAHYYIGSIYHSTNKVKKAIEHYKKVLNINPENVTTTYILAHTLVDLYFFKEAKKYLLNYLEVFPDNSKINSFIGRIYYIENNPKSLHYLRKGISKDSYGILSKSLYYELLGKDKEALKYIDAIIEKAPMLISPHIAAARINKRNNNKNKAISEYFTAGVLLYKNKLFNMSRANFINVLSINDKISEIYYYIGKIYEETNKLGLAIINLKKAYELKEDTSILVQLGYLYSLKNNFTESTKYFDKAIIKEPKNPKPYFFKGMVYSRNNNYSVAEKLLKKAIDLQNNNDVFYFYLATVLEKQNKLYETIDTLKKAIKYNPNNAKAYNYLGYIYADRNMNLNESIDLIQKALVIDPFNGAYLDSLGWAYYRKGKYKRALKIFLRAEIHLKKENIQDPVVYDHIGDTYKMTGNKKKAIEYWEKSIKIKSDTRIEKKIEKILK
ncbi:MAG: tetratricopeptide repeat protein [Spirochaetota bacterium]|nr:tetratricopeptide repeat protein [Spirochaetota bacterium]